MDSIPSDLGTYLLVNALEKVENVRCAVMEIKGGISGGSVSSALNLIEMFPAKELLDTYKTFALSPISPSRGIAQPSVVYDDRLGGWLGPWPMSYTNAAIVCRTYGLFGGRWGDKFSYREYMNWGSWLYARGAQIGLGMMGPLLMIPPLRWLARKFAPNSGEGPDEEALKNGKFTMKIVADTETGKTGSITISSNCDAAYLLTGKIPSDFSNLAMMVVESGLTLAQDVENTEIWALSKGKTLVLTPALMGETLRERLEKGGLHFSLNV